MKKNIRDGLAPIVFGSKFLRVMKLSIIISVVFVVQAFASSYSQTTRLTLNMENTPILKVLETIEQESEFSFFYRDKDVDVNKSVTLKADKELISEILDKIFKGQDIAYTITDRHIVLFKDEFSGQDTTKRFMVTGIVTERTGEPMVGVNIVVKGTLNGTITDPDGKYSITVPSDQSILVFSFLGYESQEVMVGGKRNIDIVMNEEIQSLDEVLVIGYGTQKRRDITTAVASISTSDISSRPIISAAQAIQGKASGVQVTEPSGKPGVSLSIRVRGSTSVQAGNEPLYIVDGVPTSDISMVNANDIESIQILKDASSAAIYGARAANGVVLINTKRGISKGSTVSFNTNWGISDLDYKIKALNTSQYRELMSDLIGPGTVPDSYTHYTNWVDETFKTGTFHNYQLSVSGGNEKNRYFLSAASLYEKGIVRPASYGQNTFRLNLDNQVKDWLNLKTNLSYANGNRHDAEDNLSVARGGIILSAINTPPFLHIWNPAPGLGDEYEPNPYQPSWENPLAYMSRAGREKSNRFLGNIQSIIDFKKGLTFNTNFGIDYHAWQWSQYIDPIKTSYGRQENGKATLRNNTNFNWLLENTLNYTGSWNGHNLTGLVGMTMQKNSWDNSEIDVKDFPKNTSVKTLNAANQIENAFSQSSEWAIMSYLGRLSYNYQSRYLITANFRYDGSSKLAKQHRWGFFPSFSAGWRISSEPFMEGLTFINDLKLRAGWGENGNQEGIADYASYGLFTTSRVPITDPLSGPDLERSTFENKDLRWETTDQTDIGLDLSMFNSRIVFTVDAYLKKTRDLLLNVRVPRVGSADYITRNDGKMDNKGLEFNLSTKNLVHQLTWSTDFNISFNRNKVTALGLNKIYDYAEIYSNGENAIRLMPGHPLGTFFGYISKGVDPETGMIIYKDLDNSGSITANDRTVIGNAQPDFIYGMTNTFTYKGLQLNIFIQGTYGNDVFNASRIDMEGMYDQKNQDIRVLKRWRYPGQITDVPKATTDMSNVRNSTRFLENGSYLRVKDITLSYELPASLIKTVKLSKLTVFGTAQNLLTLTKYTGFDPEVNAYGTSGVELGVDYGTYPHARTFIFGLNVEF